MPWSLNPTLTLLSDLLSSGTGGLLFTENRDSISIGKTEMIYLQNTQEAQEVYVPRSNGMTPDGDLVFKARNTINLTEEIDLYVSDLQVSDLYYFLAVTLPDEVTDGEYEYELKFEDTILATGLLVVGDFAKPDQYEKDVTYEQYETE